MIEIDLTELQAAYLDMSTDRAMAIIERARLIRAEAETIYAECVSVIAREHDIPDELVKTFLRTGDRSATFETPEDKEDEDNG